MIAPSYENLFTTAVETFDESKVLFSETKAKIVSLDEQNGWEQASSDRMSLFIACGLVGLMEEKLDSDLVLVKSIWQEDTIVFVRRSSILLFDEITF